MSICLDDLDRFGVPLRKSFLPESDLVVVARMLPLPSCD